jgi:hypothetical protein
VRSLLQSFFDSRCILGHWLRYKENPAFECFIKGGQKAGRCALVVHLLPRGSRLDYITGSHLVDLPIKQSDRLTHETEESAIAGSTIQGREFENGGLVVRDARLRVRITKGYAITLVFATEALVAGWPKMPIQASEALIQLVSRMESSSIGFNFKFTDRHAAKAP